MIAKVKFCTVCEWCSPQAQHWGSLKKEDCELRAIPGNAVRTQGSESVVEHLPRIPKNLGQCLVAQIFFR